MLMPPTTLPFNLELSDATLSLSLKEVVCASFPAIEIEHLTMRVPDVSFPLDLTQGKARFRQKRCLLQEVALKLSLPRLQETLRERFPEREVVLTLRSHTIELGGIVFEHAHKVRFLVEVNWEVHGRWFTFRITDVKTFGPTRVPGMLMAVTLVRHLIGEQESVASEFVLAKAVRPDEVRFDLLRWVLERTFPCDGWRVPNDANLECTVVETDSNIVRFKFVATRSESSLMNVDTRSVGLCRGDEEASPRSLREWVAEQSAQHSAEPDMAHYLEAHAYENEGRLQEAAGCYERIAEAALALDARRETVFACLKASELLAAEYPERAIASLQTVLTIEPNHREVLSRIASYYELIQRYPEAIEAYRCLLSQDALTEAEQQDVRIRIANALFQSGHYAECISWFRQAIPSAKTEEQHPLFDRVIDACLRSDDPRQAVHALMEAGAALPQGKQKASRYARAAELWQHTLGDLASARRCYEIAVDAYPYLLPALDALESLYRQSEDFAALLTVLQHKIDAVQHHPKYHAGLWVRLAETYRRLERIDDARGAYLNALGIDEASVPALIAMARDEYDRRDVALAELYYRRLLDAMKHRGDASDLESFDWNTIEIECAERMAEFAALRGDIDAEIANLQRAVTLVPRHRHALDRLEALYERQGNFHEAIAILERRCLACDDESLHLDVSLRLASLLRRVNRLEDAERQYAMACDRFPTEWRAHRARIEFFKQSHQRAKQRIALETVATLAEAHATRWNSEQEGSIGKLWIDAASIAFENHQMEQAERDLQRALRHDDVRADAMVQLAQRYRTSGHRTQRIALFREWLSTLDESPTRSGLEYDYAALLVEEGDYDRARTVLTRVVTAPETAELNALRLAIRVCEEQAAWTEVSTLYEALLTNVERDDERLAIRHSLLRLARGPLANPRRAKALALDILELSPSDLDAHIALAELYEEEGNSAQATHYLDAYLRQTKAQPSPHGDEARLMLRVIDALNKAQDVEPDRVSSLLSMGLERGRNNEAMLRAMLATAMRLELHRIEVQCISALIQLDPDDTPELCVRRATLLYHAGDAQGAVSNLRLALPRLPEGSLRSEASRLLLQLADEGQVNQREVLIQALSFLDEEDASDRERWRFVELVATEMPARALDVFERLSPEKRDGDAGRALHWKLLESIGHFEHLAVEQKHHAEQLPSGRQRSLGYIEAARTWSISVGRSDQALYCLMQAAKSDPHLDEMFIPAIEQILVSNGAVEEALLLVTQLVDHELKERPIYCARLLCFAAKLHYLLDHAWEDRATCYERALTLDLFQQEAFDALTRLYQEGGAFQSLSELLQRRALAVAKGTERMMLLERAARVELDHLHRLPSALILADECFEFCRSSTHRDESRDACWLNLASLYGRIGDLDRIATLIQSLLEERAVREDLLTAVINLILAEAREKGLAYFEITRMLRRYNHARALEWLLNDRMEDGAIDNQQRAELALDVGTTYFDAGELSVATTWLEKCVALTTHPRVMERASKQLEAIYEQEHRYDAVIELLKAQIACHPHDPVEQAALYRRMGRCYLTQLQQPLLAARALFSGFRCQLHRLELFQEAADLFERQGAFEELSQELAQVLSHLNERDRVQVLYRQALCFLRLQRRDEAISTLHSVLAIAPEYGDAQLHLAEQLLLNDEWCDAASHFMQAAQCMGDVKDAARHWLTAGTLYAKIDEDERALTCIERSIALDGTSRNAYEAVVPLYRAQGNIQRLIQALSRLVTLVEDPDVRVRTMTELAESYGLLGNVQMARTIYLGILQRQPRDLAICERLVTVAEKLHDWRSVGDIVRRQIDLAETREQTAQYLSRYARVLSSNLGDERSAMTFVRRAIDLDRHQLAYREQLIALLEATGQYAVAGQEAKRTAHYCSSGEQRARWFLRAVNNFAACGWKDEATFLLKQIPSMTECAEVLTAVQKMGVEGVAPTLHRDAELHANALNETHDQQADVSDGVTTVDPVDATHRADRSIEHRIAELIHRRKTLPLTAIDARLRLHLQIAQLYLQNAAPHAAREHLEAILQIDGNHRDALQWAVQCYRELNDYDALAQVLQQSALLVENRQQRVELYVELADVYASHLLDHDAALATLRKAYDLVPTYYPVLARLVDFFWAKGDVSSLAMIAPSFVEAGGVHLDESRIRVAYLAAATFLKLHDPTLCEVLLAHALGGSAMLDTVLLNVTQVLNEHNVARFASLVCRADREGAVRMTIRDLVRDFPKMMGLRLLAEELGCAFERRDALPN